MKKKQHISFELNAEEAARIQGQLQELDESALKHVCGGDGEFTPCNVPFTPCNVPFTT
jgi:hypothetical protein